nr:uncharacterized protein LOC111509210 [Leptinotarsa decemlineata]
MGEVSGDHKLWVSLSALGDGNVFAVLPQLMKQMLSDEMCDTEEDFADVILPSDNTWQTKIYYQLVEKQRMVDAKSEEETMFDPMMQEEKIKMHEWNTISKPKSIDCDAAKEWIQKNTKVVKGSTSITWTVGDIAKAGCLLSSPPIPTTFEDEHEMRRVYTLIYDVFRYKNVLTQALNDVNFFQIFPKLISLTPHVWLLFYDLYHRSFKKRETKVAKLASQLFDTYGLSFTENALWCQKIKLAASVARLRIKHNALSLGELLPPHLKDERVTEQAKNNPVTCWVNSLKISDAAKLCKDIEESFNLEMITDIKQIGRNNFRWDRHCPQIIAFHASIRPKLAKSRFVKEHLLIVQDKSFCLGPATFGKLIEDLELTGSVIQTHVNSPRTTAYLATILSHNEKIRKLMAFSAGKRKSEYEMYFSELGMSNIVIFSDRLIDTPADANYMEEVVAVFATPPNSYSAVADPIDLVCSRGGDLSMLEVLTESGDSKEARERVANILEEQRKTLRFAMSRPQIQFVLYETHSELEAENSFMVKKALREINRIAKLQHAALQGKILDSKTQETPEQSEINNNEKVEKTQEDEIEQPESSADESTSSEDIVDSKEKMLDTLNVPDTDIFDLPELPRLCSNENCNNFEREGCYLALLQRKQVIRLDDKYMIQMAENRGLFGSNTTTSTSKSKSSRTAKKKQEIREKQQRPRKKLKESEIDRIAAPTHAFLLHTKPLEDVEICRKYENGKSKTTIYRNWWRQTTRHILSLKKTLLKQKCLPNLQHRNSNVKAVVNSFWKHMPR